MIKRIFAILLMLLFVLTLSIFIVSCETIEGFSYSDPNIHSIIEEDSDNNEENGIENMLKNTEDEESEETTEEEKVEGKTEEDEKRDECLEELIKIENLYNLGDYKEVLRLGGKLKKKTYFEESVTEADIERLENLMEDSYSILKNTPVNTIKFSLYPDIYQSDYIENTYGDKLHEILLGGNRNLDGDYCISAMVFIRGGYPDDPKLILYSIEATEFIIDYDKGIDLVTYQLHEYPNAIVKLAKPGLVVSLEEDGFDFEIGVIDCVYANSNKNPGFVRLNLEIEAK